MPNLGAASTFRLQLSAWLRHRTRRFGAQPPLPCHRGRPTAPRGWIGPVTNQAGFLLKSSHSEKALLGGSGDGEGLLVSVRGPRPSACGLGRPLVLSVETQRLCGCTGLCILLPRPRHVHHVEPRLYTASAAAGAAADASGRATAGWYLRQ